MTISTLCVKSSIGSVHARELSENALMSSLRPATLLRCLCQLRRLFYANRVSSLDILVYAKPISRPWAFLLEALDHIVS